MPDQTDHRAETQMPDPLNPMGSPIKDAGSETWRPKRGPVFKMVVWALLILIAALVVLGLVTGLIL